MKKKILFLCVYNSVRSQMAEGIMRHLASGEFEVKSAGTHPTGVNPDAVKVLSEIGIDISKQRSKSVDEFKGVHFDYVITLCDDAKQTCPIFAGKYEKVHWDLKDPAQARGTDEERLPIFRKVREQIKENILRFLNSSKGKKT